jgi:hypothetical protein
MIWLALNLEVMRLQEKGFTTAFGFLWFLSIFFSLKMLEEFILLAFSPAKLFLIGVDWSTSELLVKIVL